MKRNPKQMSLFGLTLAFLVIAGTSVSALPPQANAHAQTGLGRAASLTQANSHQPLQAEAARANAQTNAQSHLTTGQQKSCQNRQKVITNIMARIADRGQKQLTLFTTIATRVENFYTSKGKTLSNYDTLVADVNSQQAAAQSAVDAVKTASTGFSCTSSDPKAFVDSFKTRLMSEIAALQAYRTSVKNLIVGVKSVESTTQNTNQTTQGANSPSTGQANQTTNSGGTQ